MYFFSYRVAAEETPIPPPANEVETIISSFEEEQENKVPCETGEFRTIPGDCASYKVCVDGELYYQRCATGLHWVASKKSCDWPENSDCGQEVKVKTSSEGKTCNFGGMKANAEDKNSWLECIDGKVIKRKCAPKLVFNPDLKVCDWPKKEQNEEGNSQGNNEVANFPPSK